ncbi:MAG: hypothetical protein ACRC2B_20445 [Rubrivivax sp.]
MKARNVRAFGVLGSAFMPMARPMTVLNPVAAGGAIWWSEGHLRSMHATARRDSLRLIPVKRSRPVPRKHPDFTLM